MKKLFIFTALIFSALISFAQSIPEFDKGDAFVFEHTRSYSRTSSPLSFKAKNFTYDSYFEVTLYGYKNEGWQKIGAGFLKTMGDSDEIETFSGKDCQYFAVKANSDQNFNYVISKKANTLYILLLNQNDFSEKLAQAETFDTKSIKGKFKDNFYLIEKKGFDERNYFHIFGSDKEDSDFVHISTIDIERAGDAEKEDFSFTTRDITSYRFLKIISEEDIDYSYNLFKRKDDLFIEAR